MGLNERAIRLWRSVRPHALRALCCAFIFSFLLPYVDVLGCSTKKMSTYYGYQLICEEKASAAVAALYILTIVVFAVILALLFYRRETGRALKAFAAAWRAIAAAFCGLIIWDLPDLQFLFDAVFAREGQVIGLASAALLFVDGMAVAARGYADLARQRDDAARYSKPLLRYHIAVIVFSLCLVPLIVAGMLDEICLVVLTFLLLSLPFAFSQVIVLEGVKRDERWTRVWAVAVFFVMAGAVVLGVMGVM